MNPEIPHIDPDTALGANDFVARRHLHEIDVRVSLLEQQNLMTTKQLCSINDNIKWLVRIVLGGTISALLVMLFNNSGGVM